MKKELTDLIPVEGLLRVHAKSNAELDRNHKRGIRKEISLREFN